MYTCMYTYLYTKSHKIVTNTSNFSPTPQSYYFLKAYEEIS